VVGGGSSFLGGGTLAGVGGGGAPAAAAVVGSGGLGFIPPDLIGAAKLPVNLATVGAGVGVVGGGSSGAVAHWIGPNGTNTGDTNVSVSRTPQNATVIHFDTWSGAGVDLGIISAPNGKPMMIATVAGQKFSVYLPPAGSVTLASGAVISWNNVVTSKESSDLRFSVTAPGKAPLSWGGAQTTSGAHVAAPFTLTELQQLVSAMVGKAVSRV
jgi:hypothetical protein